MAEFIAIHPENPQPRLIARVVDRLRQGAVIVYPTDSCYALGCHLDDKAAADRLRVIRQFDKHHLFTLVCRDLSDIAHYARVDNRQYRMLKATTPGPTTFVLQATKQAPRRLQHEKRKTIGLRVPDSPIVQAMLGQLGDAMSSCTLGLPPDDEPVSHPDDVRDQLDKLVDVVVEGGDCGVEPTTVIDWSGELPVIARPGKGAAEWEERIV
ncbi:L-threonylcarbamoyladenylate synthase [Algiphilus sp.]|uniref:L-threonylcarbamoyladenylate synthase n=1 Tax=Algiphilus sp. TaxID=1872431 RepID=UPI001CA6E854|nr:L-threonylcarbamoyladenylate synthase [Algiphilus sp.]MBY8965353.1 threonylcarbamoyl-AMP synthase [Algiphilus acroporae]MCI5102645.1 threonylcarbamoyl-AMP synthase [Algiphilus sp.]MCR9089967.1 L-threonylcarbamoyladenylate synthase [Pseudomonadota bacterium]